MTALQKPQTTRRAAKGVRKRQLIEAAITSIAKRGLGDTTLAHVSQSAGLSQGIINLHFTNKENLLYETLNFIRDEYEKNWQSA
ncbi:TetR family transcriptional regulator, partial [Emcibacteraceae bacterium]|nr:TetR family transcriptional regulator [Emcibacteraceae bacterium]